MVNMHSPVSGFTHPGYYSRIIPPSTLTIVSPSLAIQTGRWVGADGQNNAIGSGLLVGAIVLGSVLAVWALS